jgi:hypothetical protein
MFDERLDNDGYPTEQVLEAIEKWDYRDIPGVFALIRELWWPDFEPGGGWGVSEGLSPEEHVVVHGPLFPERRFIRFATGGWSGNESLIYALRRNQIIWSVTWSLSSRGGLHIFTLDRGVS